MPDDYEFENFVDDDTLDCQMVPSGIFSRQDKTHPDGEVYCKCGSTKFKLTYGDYCIIATCECGNHATVYTG